MTAPTAASSPTKTLALFGAGAGLGAALARRFGKEGYRVALVARRPAALAAQVEALGALGIAATAFPADVTDLPALPALVATLEATLGGIDAAVFLPLSPDLAFVPAQTLDAAQLRPLLELFTFAPIELARALLPGLLRRQGAFVYGNGLSSIVPMAGMSGVGPAMAAARNYIYTLHEELKPQGAFAGAVTIGAMIAGSESHAKMTAHGAPPGIPVLAADVIADEVWTLVTARDRVEAVLPPLPAHA